MQRTEIINPSLHVFCYDLQEHIQNGYEIDPDNTPVTWGVAYQVGLIKREPSDANVDAVFNLSNKQLEVLESVDPILFSGGAFASTTEPHVQPLKRGPGRPKVSK